MTTKTDLSLDDQIAGVMKVDPLGAAEEITGQTVEDGGLGFAFGLGMVQAKSTKMRELLNDRGDVWDGMPLEGYRAIVERYGFELVLETEFDGRERKESFFVYAHRDGLLLKFDTYEGSRVNSGNVYYCWRPHNRRFDSWLISSGGYIGPDYTVWAGDHDCREALIFNLDRLRANGAFVTPWPKRPFLWLLHYGDSKVDGYDYAAINATRIAMMPDWVRKMVGAAYGAE